MDVIMELVYPKPKHPPWRRSQKLAALKTGGKEVVGGGVVPGYGGDYRGENFLGENKHTSKGGRITLKREWFKKILKEALLSNGKDPVLTIEVDKIFYKFALTLDIPKWKDKIITPTKMSFIFIPANYDFTIPLYFTWGIGEEIWKVELLP